MFFLLKRRASDVVSAICRKTFRYFKARQRWHVVVLCRRVWNYSKKRFRGLMHYVSQLNVLDAMKIVGELFTSHAMARISSFYSLCLYSSLSPWICWLYAKVDNSFLSSVSDSCVVFQILNVFSLVHVTTYATDMPGHITLRVFVFNGLASRSWRCAVCIECYETPTTCESLLSSAILCTQDRRGGCVRIHA